MFVVGRPTARLMVTVSRLSGWPPRALVVPNHRRTRSFAVLAVHDLELRVGARLLMEDVELPRRRGDKIGLVGRNGAGEDHRSPRRSRRSRCRPPAGSTARGEIGYLPQDPRSGDPESLARTRILDARGLGAVDARPGAVPRRRWAARTPAVPRPRWAATASSRTGSSRWAATRPRREAASIASNLALPDRILDQPLKTALRRPAAAHRAGAHPVLRRRHDDPRRARPTTSTPTRWSGCASS